MDVVVSENCQYVSHGCTGKGNDKFDSNSLSTHFNPMSRLSLLGGTPFSTIDLLDDKHFWISLVRRESPCSKLLLNLGLPVSSFAVEL